MCGRWCFQFLFVEKKEFKSNFSFVFLCIKMSSSREETNEKNVNENLQKFECIWWLHE